MNLIATRYSLDRIGVGYRDMHDSKNICGLAEIGRQFAAYPRSRSPICSIIRTDRDLPRGYTTLSQKRRPNNAITTCHVSPVVDAVNDAALQF